jgi:hypothetical protein
LIINSGRYSRYQGQEGAIQSIAGWDRIKLQISDLKEETQVSALEYRCEEQYQMNMGDEAVKPKAEDKIGGKWIAEFPKEHFWGLGEQKAKIRARVVGVMMTMISKCTRAVIEFIWVLMLGLVFKAARAGADGYEDDW